MTNNIDCFSDSSKASEFASIDVPDQPALAPGVRLAGKISGFAFKEQQWLVQVDGEFIQMTEVLYRLAEQIDGSTRIDGIAAALTNETEWLVSADDVRALIRSQLIPLNLIKGCEASGASQTRPDKPSPLDVNLRFAALSERQIKPVADVLKHLCALPVVATMLATAGAAHWWLYRMHGISRAFNDMVYTPGGLLLVLALVLLAAVFHEFGHASALRRNGGTATAMGFGFYLMYPAFYTDVSDGYRLGRWARAWTDLGGIYFHLIFTVALLAVFRITGRELLLFAIVLIDLDVLRQFIPIVRLDGYWLCADLIGIPDFFSQMAPFIRSTVPGSEARLGDRLPELRTWVKGIFICYIVVTIPTLTYLFIRMVVTLPGVTRTSYGSLAVQASTLVRLGAGNPLTSLLVLTQIIFLVLPVFGTAYLILTVMRGPALAAWRWSTSSNRNVAATVAGVACCCILFLIVPPALRLHTSHSGAPDSGKKLNTLPSPNDRGRQVLEETREAMTKIDTLKADLEGWLGTDHFRGTMILKRPNLARVEIRGSRGMGSFMVVSDGSTPTTYFSDDHQYVQRPSGATGQHIQGYVVEQVADFFRPNDLAVRGTPVYVGREIEDGTTVDVVDVVHVPPTDTTIRYVIAAQGRTIRRITTNGNQISSSSLKHVAINEAVIESSFVWALPASATPLHLPPGIQLPVK
jgi:hypothetical protein